MKRSKKYVALLLCLAMLLGMMPAMALGATESEPETTAPELVDATENTAGNIKLTKALYLNDGTYSIEMEAYAEGEAVVETETVPTDFVIVVDQSGSMGDNDPFDENDGYITIGRGIDDLSTLDTEFGATEGFYVGVMKQELVGYSSIRKMLYNNGEWYYWKYFKDGWYNPHWEIINEESIYDLADIRVLKINAAKVAVKNFIKTVNDNDNDSTTEADHRIAIVGFSSEGYNNTEIFTGCTIDDKNNGVQYGNTEKYRNATKTALVAANSEGLADVVKAFTAKGATSTDIGMQMAEDILTADQAKDPDAYEKRNHVIIVVTDGVPTTSDTFDKTVANAAISNSYDCKNGLDATVYSLGLELGSNNAQMTTFMNFLSSNYQKAENMTTGGDKNEDNVEYYIDVTSASALEDAFETIAIDSIEIKATLSTDAILRDVINDDIFDISGLDESKISVYTAPWVGKTTPTDTGWGDRVEVDLETDENITVEVTDGKVSVSGFDYKGNAVDTESTSSGGAKLIIKIDGLVLKDGILIPVAEEEEEEYVFYSNKEAGIYLPNEDEEKDEVVLSIASPEIPAETVTVKYYKDADTEPYATKTYYSIAGCTLSQSNFDTTAPDGYTLKEVKPFTVDNTTFTVGKGDNLVEVYFVSEDDSDETVEVTYIQPADEGYAGSAVTVKVSVGEDSTIKLATLAAVKEKATTTWENPKTVEFKGWKLYDNNLAANPLILENGSYNVPEGTTDVTFIAVYEPKTPETKTIRVNYIQPDGTGCAGDPVIYSEVEIDNDGNITLESLAAVEAKAAADNAIADWEHPNTVEFKGWKLHAIGDDLESGNDTLCAAGSDYKVPNAKSITFEAVYGAPDEEESEYVTVVYTQPYDPDYSGYPVDFARVEVVDGNITLESLANVMTEAEERYGTEGAWSYPSKKKFVGWKQVEFIAELSLDDEESEVNDKVYAAGDEFAVNVNAGEYIFEAVYKDKSNTVMYTLSFETNGGTEIAEIVRAGGTVVDLDEFVPTKKGYSFKGWYTDRALTNKVTSVTLTENMTVYAKWSEKSTNGDGTPSDLNSKDHIRYVVGYPDGTVRPTANVTRAETAAMLYRLLTDERRSEVYTTRNAFSDVDASLWYNEPVSSMYKGGYVSGYTDGTFGGDNNITRAEFVCMLVRFIGEDEGVMNFTDVPRSHWAYQDIAIATAQGWISGYSDGTFKPDQPITRAEAMSIINRVLNRGVNANSNITGAIDWPDNPKNAWYFYDVVEATNSHDYTGSRPSENWSNVNK